MLFQVPMPYEVTGVQKGKRLESKEQFWEYVEVDIPVLSDEIAPVAIVWQDGLPTNPEIWSMHERDKWKSTNPYPEDGVQMTRFFEGEHYVRRYDRLSPDGLAASLNPQNSYHILSVGHIWHGDADKDEKPVAAVPYREDKFFATNYEAKVAELREKASRFFIVGNDIFERSSEPVIIKTSYRTENSATTIPRIVPKDKLDEKTQTFRIDRYAEVVESCNEVMKRWRDDTPEVTMARAPEVYLEEAFAYDDTTENLVNAVRTFIGKYGEDRARLGSVEPRFGIAFLNLKLALQHFDETGDLSDVEEWAGILTEHHEKEIQYSNIAISFREYADRPIDAPVNAGQRRTP